MPEPDFGNSYLVSPAPFEDLIGSKEKSPITCFTATTDVETAIAYYTDYTDPPFTAGDQLAYSLINTLSAHFDCTPDRLVMAGQPHGTGLGALTELFVNLPIEEQIKRLGKADAMMTDLTGYFLCLRTADCLPVLFYDPVHHVIAVAHCGWRNTVLHIAAGLTVAMTIMYQTRMEDLQVAFGPCISMQHYEIGEEVVELFRKADFPMSSIITNLMDVDEEGHTYSAAHLSLQATVADELQRVGVPKENIRHTTLCTYEHDGLFSVRRDGQRTGRLLTGIRLNPR
jgi:YfiH family protein